MVLRNRLIALLIRIAIFTVYAVCFGPFLAEFSSFWAGLGHFCVEIGLVGMILMGLEIIFNAIDLMRHGIRGVAAGPYMPFGLPVNVFCALTGMIYLVYLLPNGFAPVGVFAIIFNSALIIGPMVDWLLLEEKGTVRYAHAFTAMLFPILYHVFGYFRTVIWDDVPFFGGNMYALPFLEYGTPNIVLYSVLYFATCLGALILSVFLNDVFAGKFAIARSED